jgi:hypothetical protein
MMAKNSFEGCLLMIKFIKVDSIDNFTPMKIKELKEESADLLNTATLRRLN